MSAATGMKLPKTMTVSLMARLLHVDERHYRRIEKGTAHGASVELIEDIAKLLRLSSDEVEMLYLWCGKTPPRVPQVGGEVPPELLSVMHAESHGAYWCSSGYQVMGANERALANWPWMRRPGVNVLVSLLQGEGRAQCVEWETRWAPLLLAQLRRELIESPDNDELLHLVDRLVGDPVVERIWRATAESQPRAYGTRRDMIMPPWGVPVEITVTALVPAGRPDLRLVVGVPAPGVVPEFPALPAPPG